MGASRRIKNKRTGRNMGTQLSIDGPDSECTFHLGIHRLKYPREYGFTLVVI